MFVEFSHLLGSLVQKRARQIERRVRFYPVAS
jgi:hypothetical protein